MHCWRLIWVIRLGLWPPVTIAHWFSMISFACNIIDIDNLYYWALKHVYIDNYPYFLMFLSSWTMLYSQWRPRISRNPWWRPLESHWILILGSCFNHQQYSWLVIYGLCMIKELPWCDKWRDILSQRKYTKISIGLESSNTQHNSLSNTNYMSILTLLNLILFVVKSWV